MSAVAAELLAAQADLWATITTHPFVRAAAEYGLLRKAVP